MPRLEVRVIPSERAAFAERAAREGLPRSRWVRRCCSETEIAWTVACAVRNVAGEPAEVRLEVAVLRDALEGHEEGRDG